ncbi:spermidine/putrescine ABC transporter ATP-binding protein PotA [Enterobacter bugandensis]|uniref:Spermidine/putrescine import ATP-binding protein PotA n=1 Tax=Enterobacter bugandensis TaxID=881260 RepID=A0AA42PWJ0_9ENTR|nr:spermidine/putrescine ABC transporter ATP-binding protein PotA [Enterobacter bugandensis]MDH1321413.1 spermidine/putrescine ABC transporter ATP-binding protein PotA [Enterobacter bugandensis]
MDSEKSDPLLTLSGLTKSHDGKVIIHGLDLTVRHGEFMTLLGPSGCGKTTVLRLIAGLEWADSGRILLEGDDITATPAEERHTNTVFQSYALFPHMSVFDNVAFGLRMQKVPADELTKRVNEALERVQLSGLKYRRPDQLSGGQQQRVAIARAVINNPKVLLLDESLSALDYRLRREMQNELKLLQRKLGITFIFVTHDQEEALSMSDRIIVLREGKIEQDGTPREIYEEPRTMFVAQFIGESNILDARVINRIDENCVRAFVENVECTIWTQLNVEADQHIKVLLRPEDIQLEVINDREIDNALIGFVREKNYKGMTIESLVELVSGKTITVSEFFNEDAPDVDLTLGQRVSVRWFENWEVVLYNENYL